MSSNTETQPKVTLTDLVKHAFDDDADNNDWDNDDTGDSTVKPLSFKDLKTNNIYIVYPSRMSVGKFGLVFLLELADSEKPNELFSVYAPNGYREIAKKRLGDPMLKHIMKYGGMSCENNNKKHVYKIAPFPAATKVA